MSEVSPAGPRLSIIVPTCQRAPALARCLEGLTKQTVPAADLEIIVVDDAGTDTSGADLSAVKTPVPVQVIRHEENSGAAAARNTGARAARAPFIAFIDDDCIPDSTWAENLLNSLGTENGSAVAGEVIIGEPQRATDRVTQLLSSPMPTDDGSLSRAQTANLAVPTECFREVGGFDERFRSAGYEDYDFCQRWRAAGYRIISKPEAVVHHMRNTDLLGFWRQHFRYGKGAYLHYGGGQGAPRPPLTTTWQRMLQTIAGGRTFSERLQHTGLVGLSQVAMLTGFATRRFSRT